MKKFSKMSANENFLERNVPGLGRSVSMNDFQPKSISHLEDCISESIDLPGSVLDTKEEFNNDSICNVKSTKIDEESDQFTQVTPAKESFMKRLSVRIKQLSLYKQFTGQNRNDTATNEVILTSFTPWKKNERIEVTSEDLTSDTKTYIPYECAKFHIIKIVEDMHEMRNKHIKHIREIEASLHAHGKENKEQCIQMLKKQHRDMLAFFKEVLQVYQENNKKNNKCWEDLVQNLKQEKSQLVQEKIDVYMQSKQEFEQWEKQKTNILEEFSQKMDLLHVHPTSTLKELQKTGLKLKGEQEILKPQQEVPIAEKQEKHCLQANSEIKVSDHPDFERQENYSQEVQEQKPNFKIGSTLGETENIGIEKWATVIGLPKGVQEKELYLSASQASKENFLEKDCLMFPDSYTRENEASGTDHTEITEARIKLEKLKQSLSKKEEEITELLKNKNKLKSDFRISAKHQLDHSDATSLLLLKRILEKFHSVYSRVPEAQQFIDCLLKESERKAMTAKETLKRVQDNVVDSRQVVRGNPTEFNRCLEEAQTELWEAEIIVKALGSIRSGFINEQLDSIMAGDECGLQEGKGRASSTAHHGKCEERTVSWFAYKGQTILGSQHVLISQEGTFPKETEEGKATGPHLDNLLQGYN